MNAKSVPSEKRNNFLSENGVTGKFCSIDGEDFYRITNVNEMRPFFMSIVSNANHWLFIASNGGLTAGRKNADFALFPYYTDDKITESSEMTGSKSIFTVTRNNVRSLWEPFSDKLEGVHRITRNIYKSIYSNKIVFEEINHDLGLAFRYQWSTGNQFGFIRKSTLTNLTNQTVEISILDGIQNVMPYGVPCDLQSGTSNLVDAYKRTELDANSGLGIFALSAIIVDKAEPSEALKANVVWSLGLDKPLHLLSSLQLKNFRNGQTLSEETDIKGEKGAYFIHSHTTLAPNEAKQWMIVADVNQNHSAIQQLIKTIRSDKNLSQKIKQDIEAGTAHLKELVASADGLQMTSDTLSDTRHFSNTLFNIMRGGIFYFNYQIEKQDFIKYISVANKAIFETEKYVFDQLPEVFELSHLKTISQNTDNSDFQRLCLEYLPLMFSRRHGDPSRPWNKFSINTQNEDGSKVLDYEGNWRDIFQNWEALAHSYPTFTEGMITKFLNASTFEGYNPYRVTKDGFDWEVVEPENPWSYIGYWGDHQIIYLLKLLELQEKHYPGTLTHLFEKEIFVYANVPYKIKTYDDILKNPKDTIVFDSKLDHHIQQKRQKLGADGALMTDAKENIYKVNFLEKILATVLAKMSNFIPEAGIWMNTQRPEWNDANNALVGNGVSVVTLCYLRRFLKFFNEILSNGEITNLLISDELATSFLQMSRSLEQNKSLINNKISNSDRKKILDELAQPASHYRQKIYENSFSGKKTNLSVEQIKQFTQTSLAYLEHSIRANKRTDKLYHAYNLMTLEGENAISVSYLSEMLEGQVAVLSSGYLKASEAVELLDALRNSSLFRADQHSYMLYPNKELPHFLAKNNVQPAQVQKSALLQKLVADGDANIIEKDVNGTYHFNGNIRNGNDLKAALDKLTGYETLVQQDKMLVLDIYEKIFNHKAFTGRSGTFYAYEGLGSIYWHMVSKLQLAVQECYFWAVANNENKAVLQQLSDHYYDINQGIGVHKSPAVYGAFPTDPYSHTPIGKGAKQPGMTGQVKEDILSHIGELGVFVADGCIGFNPRLLKKEAFLSESKTLKYVDIYLKERELKLDKNELAFTYCQIPIVYKTAENTGIEMHLSDGNVIKFDKLSIDKKWSEKIFNRTGEIAQITVLLHL